MRILIAEDDRVSRRLLETVLDKLGYEVVSTCDGEEALATLQFPEAPRLAILDWMMPGMDGVEVCRRIRSLGSEPYTYILLLTARTRKQDIVEGMSAGADDYLVKPYDAHELQVRLNAGMRVLNLQSDSSPRGKPSPDRPPMTL